MDVLTAIYSRRSQGKVKLDQIPHNLIGKLLTAAVQAPNHFKVRPWRFTVLTGSGLEKFGDQLASVFSAKFPDVTPEAIEKERQKAFRAPLIISVGVDLPSDTKINEVENIAAAAAACQNILLAATALGLATIWRTGDAARDPEIKKFFGLLPEQHLIGLLYIGYPDQITSEGSVRPSFDDRTVWME
ncbi:MAG: nitroreductase [Chloroflexota bacterium]